jgi:hypothetical protein
MEAITVEKTSQYYATEFDFEKDFKQSLYQHFQFTRDKLIRTTLGLKRGAPLRAGLGAVAPLATLKRRLW